VSGSFAGTVIITGGSSGIGRCTATAFARAGWRVGVIARGQAGLSAIAADIEAAGARSVTATAATASADVADGAALREAADAIIAALGPPDIWINCAGNGVYGRFTDVPADEFDRVTAVTYTGTVNGTRIALRLMAPRNHGTIINVCSAIAFHGMPLMNSYAGAKAAVRGFAQSVQAELRMQRSPIRICTVLPPAVNTPFFSHAVSHMGAPARPAPPVYQPEIIAAAILLAARTAPPELLISGTVVAFSLLCRVAPRLAAFAMTQLGLDGQLTRDPAAAALCQPTLFAPSPAPSPVHGPFTAIARRRSWHLALVQTFHRPRLPNREQTASKSIQATAETAWRQSQKQESTSF
jgi:short-subunit dehydrogenase